VARLGYVGHSNQLVLDEHGEPMILVVAPKIQVRSLGDYEPLLEELLEEMTEQETEWSHW